jgi:hypothetical protein
VGPAARIAGAAAKTEAERKMTTPIEVFEYGWQQIGKDALGHADRNRLCLRAKSPTVKGEICVIADFTALELRAEGQHCYKKLDTRWQCKKFQKRIAGW